MGIPDVQPLMLPLLSLDGDGETHSLADARAALAAELGLSQADRDELLPSGRQRVDIAYLDRFESFREFRAVRTNGARPAAKSVDGNESEAAAGAETWDGTVGRPEIQKFVGALHGKRARKGVFLTTSSFSSEAVDYVSRIDPRVVLIDGRQLAEYMLDLGLGVTTRDTCELKRVDSDYFIEE